MKYLIVGLGNPGEKYANTRHNIGFIVANALVEATKGTFTTERYADVARTKYKGRTLMTIKPNTYMNLSGKAVKYWMNKEKIPVENFLVVFDDIALPTGTLRLRPKGSDSGHNGMIDIITTLDTIDFPRLRIGIGSDFAKGYQSEYVLSQWTRQEEKIMLSCIKTAVEVIQSFVTIGLEQTMNRYNKGKD